MDKNLQNLNYLSSIAYKVHRNDTTTYAERQSIVRSNLHSTRARMQEPMINKMLTPTKAPRIPELERLFYRGSKTKKQMLNRRQIQPTTFSQGFSRSRKFIEPTTRLNTWKNIRNTARKDKLLSFAKTASTRTYKAGKIGLGIGAGIAGIGFGISYGMAAMSRAANKAPVVHTGAIRNTGQTNQYFNMGADPFGGVRFASRKRY